MKRLLVGCILNVLFYGTTSLAGGEHDPPPPPEKSVLRSTKAVLPLDSTSPRPTIEAKIDGKGPFRFVFDTGAQGFVVHSDLAKELNLPVIGRAAMGDPSNPEAIEVDRVRMSSVEIDGITLSGVVADSWDRPAEMMHHPQGRGIFGLTMLAAFLVTFDYPESQIIVERGSLAPAATDNVLPWRAEDDGLPVVPLVVAGEPFRAHIDTGSPGEITLPDKFRKSFAYLTEPVVVGRGRTVNSEFQVWRGRLDGNAKLGTHVLANPNLAFISMLDSTGYANIGSSFLDDFVVTFDQKNDFVRFEQR